MIVAAVGSTIAYQRSKRWEIIAVCNGNCPPLGGHHPIGPRVVVRMWLSTASAFLRPCSGMLASGYLSSIALSGPSESSAAAIVVSNTFGVH